MAVWGGNWFCLAFFLPAGWACFQAVPPVPCFAGLFSNIERMSFRYALFSFFSIHFNHPGVFAISQLFPPAHQLIFQPLSLSRPFFNSGAPLIRKVFFHYRSLPSIFRQAFFLHRRLVPRMAFFLCWIGKVSFLFVPFTISVCFPFLSPFFLRAPPCFFSANWQANGFVFFYRIIWEYKSLFVLLFFYQAFFFWVGKTF